MRCFRVVKRVLETQEETTFPAQFDGLTDRTAPEIILNVANPIFKAPVRRLGIISSNGLMQGCPVIGIIFEHYFPVPEMLCKWYVECAQLIEQWLAIEFQVEIDHGQHGQQRHYVVILGEFFERIDDVRAIFTLLPLNNHRLFLYKLALLLVRLRQHPHLSLLLLHLSQPQAQILHAHPLTDSKIQPELICQLLLHINIMRKDEIQLLDKIDKLTVNQFYLLEQPKTPQQTFLHLYGHRVLVERAMFHKNLDRMRAQLQGSFAHSSLNIALVTSYIDNQIDFTQEEEWLVDIVHNWVNFYPTIRSPNREKYIVCRLVLQDVLDLKTVKGFSHFLAYLNIISVDVWKIIRNKKNQQDFEALRPVKEELKEMMMERVGARLDAADLLEFVSGCIPKTLLNILLSNESLPSQVKKKVKQLECLFANQGVEYFLKKHVKLSLLLKQILMILLTMEMPPLLLQRLMLLAMRYYCVYHFDKKYSAPEIVIHCYNRLTDQLRRSLNDEFTLFFKIIQKLGKNKFIDFVANNSPFAKRIIDIVKKKPTIAYPQDGANPYNTFGVAQEISIQRGATAFRYFQILEDFSIFYFRIDVPYYDITVKLYYLGEIASNKTVKTLLFTHEKTVGELKNSVNAMKKGLYMFEFDNSYSWLNSKKVYYQNQVFTPLELKVTNADEWIDQFYGNVYLNQIALDEDILVVEYKKPQERQAALEGIFVEKDGGVLRLRMGKNGSEYVYETDNVERMMQRAEEYFHAKEKYKWHINQQPVTDIAQIDNFLRGIAPATQAKEPQPQPQKKQQISLQEYKQDQQSQNQPEYEVVQRSQLQRSQILNESPSSKPSSQPQLKQSKQLISCTFQQTSQIYQS